MMCVMCVMCAGSGAGEHVASQGNQAPGPGGHQRLPGHRGSHRPRH